jgi:hypothetical protein
MADRELMSPLTGRPCKVGGPCVPTQTGPCACKELPQSATGNVLMDAYHTMQAKKHAARATDRGPVAWLPPDPPPECKSEAEKTAFAFGWFKALESRRTAREEAIYETIIQWDEGGGKRSRRELARRIVALYAATGDKP